MTVGFNTVFSKTSNINFTIKNISSLRKTISVFGSKIEYNASLDLMSIPKVSEADIRNSLIKGELFIKIKNNDIIIISSSIDLTQFDKSQKNFLLNAGLIAGYEKITNILWDESGSGDASSWAEVMNYINSNNAPTYIYVNGHYSIPAGTYELKESIFYSPKFGGTGGVSVTLEDGVLLKNLASIKGPVALISQSSSVCLDWDVIADGNPKIFIIDGSAGLINEGTHEMIEVQDGKLFVLQIANSSLINATSKEVVSLGSGSVMIFGLLFGSVYFGDAIKGPADALLINFTDGSLSEAPTFANFLGSMANTPVIKDGGAGPTSFRPVNLLGGGLKVGTTYFDRDLSPPRQIWWDGTNWTDNLGTIV